MRTFATAVCVSALLFVGCAGEDEAEMEPMGEMEPAGEVMEEEGMAPDTATMMDTTMTDTTMEEGMPEEMEEGGGMEDEMDGGN